MSIRFLMSSRGARLDYIEGLITAVVTDAGGGWRGISTFLGRWATHPIWGWVILGVILYGLYWFVGVFGAGTLVGLLEENLFGQVINPWVVEQVSRLVPIPILVDLLVGEYGLWTMGMTYALALILPIVSTFLPGLWCLGRFRIPAEISSAEQQFIPADGAEW